MQKRQLLRAGVLGGFLLLLFLLILSTNPVSADLLNVKLSDPLQPHTSLRDLKISPDGQYALFVADVITEDAYELYSVPIDGSEAPTLLSGGMLPTGAEVFEYHISPDSSRVVYLADQDSIGIWELYSVPISGGPITKLNPPIGGAGDGVKEGSRFSPDGSRVIFLAEWQTQFIQELFSVPVGGGTPVRLNGDLPMNGNIYDFEVTPDSSQVVYLASQDTAWINELYKVPLGGGVSEKLNDLLGPGAMVQAFEMSPDGSRVVYVADQDTVGQYEIYSLSLVDPAAAPVKLNPPLGADRDVVRYFRISPDGSRVVYLADKEIDDNNLFYSVPIEGGTSVKLSHVTHGTPILPSVTPNNTFEISPDSSRLVFRVVKWGTRELYSVPLTGGTVIKLNDPIIPANGQVLDFQISPDSSRVVYHANQQTGNSLEIYSVPIAGGTVAKLNSALPNLGNVVLYQISDDSQRVVYIADQQVYGEYELFSVPLADGDITQLNPPIVAGGGVGSFQISSNSNHVVYVADQETDGVLELFVTFEETPAGASHNIYMPFVHK